MGPVLKCGGMLELTLEHNPLAAGELYRPTVISRLPALQHLDQKRLTDHDRRVRLACLQHLDGIVAFRQPLLL